MSNPQPQQIPQAYVHDGTSPPVTGRFYSPNGVGIATFIGSPLAGAIVLALNYRLLRRPGAAWGVMAIGIAGMVALFAAVVQMPDTAPSLGVPLSIGMYFLAKQLQGKQFAQHVAAGGKQGSSWYAAGIGVVPTALFLLLYLNYGMGPDLPSKKMSFGNDQTIYYQAPIAAKQVRALGNYFTQEGVFGDTGGKDVLVRKEGDSYVISFVFSSEAANDEAVQEEFRAFGGLISSHVFKDAPVVMRIVDAELNELVRLGPNPD